MRSGEANLPLDGYTVRGYFYLGKPENPEAVMPVKGSASGNLATLDFPAEAYAVGQASVVVCAEKTGEQIPLYSGSYTVRNGSAKVLLDPSKTIPSLGALLGEIEDMRNVTADGRAQQKQMAEEFAGYQGEIDGVKADFAGLSYLDFTLLDDKYIRPSDGRAVSFSGYKYTDFVDVSNLAEISFYVGVTVDGTGLAFYTSDSEASFVSGVNFANYSIGTTTIRQRGGLRTGASTSFGQSYAHSFTGVRQRDIYRLTLLPISTQSDIQERRERP